MHFWKYVILDFYFFYLDFVDIIIITNNFQKNIIALFFL